MKAQRLVLLLLVLALVVGLEAVLMTHLNGQTASAPVTPSPEPTVEPTQGPTPTPVLDLEKTKPNEAGEIPILMFHRFVDELDPNETYSDDFKRYTQSFSYLRELLQRLYDMGYRVTTMNDFLRNEIKVEAGYRPIIFTFDDGAASQFSMIEQDGQLVVNPDCAAAILLEFYEKHPDFGIGATFYVNLGTATFYEDRSEGPQLAGTLQQRLQYLVDHGFEIGNHTYTHYSLPNAPDAETIIQEVGHNQAAMYEQIPDYTFTSLSLPYGSVPSELFSNLISGTYEGVMYENLGIVEVGWDPSVSPVNPDFDPYSIHRVRATGFLAEDCDFEWWLEHERDPVYISDGDPNTVTVPEAYSSLVDQSKLGDKQLRIY